MTQFFHWYGFIIGIALWSGFWLVIKKAQQEKIDTQALENSFIWILLGGVIGARVWHVLTDWSLYQANLVSALAIWQGGLSIIGAILGGMLSLIIYQYVCPSRLGVKQFLDLSVFGLPIGQAVGRLGNYVNQELYGLPTHLPWGVTIDLEHRLPGYTSFATYHPLFAYEMVAMLWFGGVIWWLARKTTKNARWLGEIGSGRWFASYLAYYSVVRFGLDFLRLEKAMLTSIIGVNQVVLLVTASLAGWYLFKHQSDLDQTHA